MPSLSDYDAWQLDSSLAFRYDAIEREDQDEKIHILIQHIKALMKINGAKGVKIDKFKRSIKSQSESEDDALPQLSDILKMSGD
jgi:hypothetical protein